MPEGYKPLTARAQSGVLVIVEQGDTMVQAITITEAEGLCSDLMEAIRVARASRKQARRRETLKAQREAHDSNNRGGRP